MSASHRDQVAQLTRQLAAAQRAAAHWQGLAEERRESYERLRSHPVVATLLVVAELALPALRRIRRSLRQAVQVLRSLVGWALAVPSRAGAGDRASRLERRLERLLDVPADPRKVSLIVLTRDGTERVAALLDSLKRRTRHRDVELIIVDNASRSATRRWLESLDGVTVIRNETNVNFADAVNAAAEVATGDVLVLLNDDVEVITDAWLRRLLGALVGDVAAVGATLVYPRRPLATITRRVDMHVAHHGVKFDLARGRVVRARNVAGGEATPTQTVREVAAATGALLAVRRDVFDELGGLDTRYRWGGEDIDLCLRIRQVGWRIVVAEDVVASHDEGATRLRSDSEARARQQQANWRRLVELHGPDLHRQVALDRLSGARLLTDEALSLLVVAGRADRRRLQHLVSDAAARGWQVRTVPTRRAERFLAHADVVVVADPTFVPDDDGTATQTRVAWADGRWDTATLDRYDVVLSADPTLLAPTHHRVHTSTELRAFADLTRLLRARARRVRIVLKIGAPSAREAATWGDWHLAAAFARALRAAGHDTWTACRDQWNTGEQLTADVVVQVKGRAVAKTYPAQLQVLWLISHPDELTAAEVDAADLVLAASRPFASWLASTTRTPVGVLQQATDPHRFYPRPLDDTHRHAVAFVGNSRHVRRPVVDIALDIGADVAVYGRDWEKFIDPKRIVARWVANDDLADVYSSVGVLLNDHWDDMRELGFVSNRIFDALACGTCVLSDHNPELGVLFGDAVATYETVGGFAGTLDALIADPTLRAHMGERGRRLVLASHTFNRRAVQLLSYLRPLLDGHGNAPATSTRPQVAVSDSHGQPVA